MTDEGAWPAEPGRISPGLRRSLNGTVSRSLQLYLVDHCRHVRRVDTVPQLPHESGVPGRAAIGQNERGLRQEAERVDARTHTGQAVVGVREAAAASPDLILGEITVVFEVEQRDVVEDERSLHPAEQLHRTLRGLHALDSGLYIAHVLLGPAAEELIREWGDFPYGERQVVFGNDVDEVVFVEKHGPEDL